MKRPGIPEFMTVSKPYENTYLHVQEIRLKIALFMGHTSL
jgi:hypothetical protein